MARFYESRPQQFVSQFVPENLALQQGYFDNLQQTQDAYKIKLEGLNKQTDALSNDVPNVIQRKKEIEGKFNSLRDINYNDPLQKQQALKGMSEINNELSPFSLIGAADKKKKDYDALQTQIAKQADKNPMKAAYLAQEAKQINLDPSRSIKIDPETGVPMNREVIPPQDFDYKDKTAYFNDLYKGVQFDQIAHNSGLSKEQAHTALYSYMTGNTKELTGKKIYESLKEQALNDPNLLKSIKAEGQYFGRDPNELLEGAIQGVVTGGQYKRVDTERKYREDAFELGQANRKAEQIESNLTTTSQSEALPGSLVKIPNELQNIEFDKDGNIKPIMSGNWVPDPGAVNDQGIRDPNAVKWVSGNKFDMNANKKVVELITNFKNEHPELKDLSPKDAVEVYKKSIKSLESESIPLNTITGEAAKNIGSSIARNKKQRNFYIYDGEGKTIDGQLSTVLNELDINEDDFNKALEKGIGGYTQAGPSAGSYYVEVPTDDGKKSRRVMISPDTEMAGIFSASQQINEARKSLKKTTVEPHPGYSVTIEPFINKNGSTTWKYTEMVKNPDGTISFGETNLDDIREAEKKQLEKSNYIGSNVGVLKSNTTQ